jgi:adenylosuccinate synthase
MRSWAVVDLGYGDAGKGATVDFLVRETGADLVVRFNGGAQAAHNVVTPDGRHHTFAQFGAASFVPNCRTHLGPRMVLDPGGLLVEAEHLARKGAPVLHRLTVDPRALVITPFHLAVNRLRERLRGDDRHGSCGIGFGETVQDDMLGLDCVYARDLVGDPRPTLRRIQERKRSELLEARELPEFEALEDPDLVEQTAEAWAEWSPTLSPELPANSGVIYEAAQGVLIDERWGFAPHTTWSNCTFENALALDPDCIKLGVIRAHSVRHGPGPFPTEDVDWPAPDRHNGFGPWQGRVRAGPLDLELLDYALDVVDGVDALSVTWLDRPHPSSPKDLLEQIRRRAPIALTSDGPTWRHRVFTPPDSLRR